MKDLANLKGAKALNRNEQKSISGGYRSSCPQRTYYCNGVCIEWDSHHFQPDC